MRQQDLCRTTALLLFGALFAAPAAAQLAEADAEITRYNVEIILFRYGPGVPQGNERFLPDFPDQERQFGIDENGDEIPQFNDLPSRPAPANAREPLAEVVLPSVDVNLRVTPRSELRLREVYDKLTLLDTYQPLLWTGWTQDAVAAALSPEVPLRRLGNAPSGFDGTLKLYLSRFLHLVVDLTLTEQVSASRADAGSRALDKATVHLRINEDRIMKNGDLRYYDHPKFGLLAKVSRVAQVGDNPAPPTSASD